jgi:2-polyprenyl-6-methoxyphenol hydroxylase-like FAD-dependent oxidoreductase
MKRGSKLEKTKDIPVLVVGAGPAGLATAITLSRYGVETLVVERRPERSSHPRATTISTRTMEIVRSWGLEQEVLAGGVDVDWLLWRCETLARVEEGVGVEIGLPTRAQAALLSPTAPAAVPQHHLEQVLLGHLRSLPSARVELGTALAGLEHGPSGVRARLRDPAGRERVVTACYVVAGDGARSRVRESLEIPMRGESDALAGVTAVVHAPIWALLGERRYGIYVTERGGEGVFLPAGPDDRWIFAHPLDPSAGGSRLPAPRDVADRVRLAAGIPDLPVRVDRIGSFSSSAQIADRFRDGRVFLAGDAAHRVTPRGGTGLNTAFQDGHGLGWKLAWVEKGWAGQDLLDSYELERRPVAEHNVARSADPDGSRRPAGDELRADLGGRLQHYWITTPRGRISTLDLLGPGSTLLTGPAGRPWQTVAGHVTGSGPLSVHSLDAITARALGIQRRDAQLYRPDGVLAHRWTLPDTSPAAGRERSFACEPRRSPRVAGAGRVLSLT